MNVPIDRTRIDEIMSRESVDLDSLAASFRGYIGYTSRLLYDELRAAGREDLIGQDLDVIRDLGGTVRALADAVEVIREQYAEVSAIADLSLPVIEDRVELLLSTIDLVTDEISFLSEAQTAVSDAMPRLGDRVAGVVSQMEEDLRELEEMTEIPTPPQIFRIHVSHLWYANYQVGQTPTPFAMTSVFLYTTRPDEWRLSTLNDALRALETEQLSLQFAGAGGFRVRKDKMDNRVRGIRDVMRSEGREPRGGATIGRIIGVEVEEIDWDEIFEVPVAGRVVEADMIRYYDEDGDEITPILGISEDEMLYYILFYKSFGGRAQSSGSYFGRVIQRPVGFDFELISTTETPWLNGEFEAELVNGRTSFDRGAARWR